MDKSKKNPTLLTEEDIAKKDNFVIVDSLLNYADRMRVGRFLNAPYTAVIHRLSPAFKKTTLFKKRAKDSFIREFTWHAFGFSERIKAEEDAYDTVEKVYGFLREKDRIPVRPLEVLYGNTDIEIAFKKALIVELAAYFEVANSVKYFIEKGKHVTLSPSFKWLEIHSWMKDTGYKDILPDDFITNKGFFLSVEKCMVFLKKIVYAFRLPVLAAWILSGVRRIHLRVKPQAVKLAVRMYSSSWGLDGKGKHSADWLLDGEAITRDNSIFVYEWEPRGNPRKVFESFQQKARQKGYTMVRQDRRHPFRHVSVRFLKDVFFGKGLKCLIAMAPDFFKSPLWAINTATRAWYEFLRWQSFTEKWAPEHYFTYNDITVGHICRNLILWRGNCQCWLFEYSNSKFQIYDMSRSLRDAERAYLKYDHELHWAEEHISLSKRQRSGSGSYYAYGPVFCEGRICRDLQDDGGRLERRIKEKWGDAKPGLTLACFTTSTGPGAVNGEKAHFRFLKSLEGLLDNGDFPGLKIIFKPKKPDYAEYMGSEGTEISDAYERLRAHPRFIIADSRYAFAPVIRFADIVLSMAFASPTVEALFSGKKAFYYDPCNHFPNSFFNKIPGFVAHTREELETFLKYWKDMEGEEFNKYFTKYISGMYGAGLAGKGAAIIREKISKRIENENEKRESICHYSDKK